MLNVVSFAYVIRKRYLNTVLFVLQNTSNVSDSTFFFPFNICTIADHVLSCILGKFKYNHQKKRKVEFFSVFVSTHHQFKCCQNKNTNEYSHVNGQRLQTEKNVNRRKTKSNKFNILRCVFFRASFCEIFLMKLVLMEPEFRMVFTRHFGLQIHFCKWFVVWRM